MTGMLIIDEENPSPRVFHLEGEKILTSYQSTVLSLISQLVPERKKDVEAAIENRRKEKKK
jgi:hypothetical protein